MPFLRRCQATSEVSGIHSPSNTSRGWLNSRTVGAVNCNSSFFWCYFCCAVITNGRTSSASTRRPSRWDFESEISRICLQTSHLNLKFLWPDGIWKDPRCPFEVKNVQVRARFSCDKSEELPIEYPTLPPAGSTGREVWFTPSESDSERGVRSVTFQILFKPASTFQTLSIATILNRHLKGMCIILSYTSGRPFLLTGVVVFFFNYSRNIHIQFFFIAQHHPSFFCHRLLHSGCRGLSQLS